MYDCPWPNWVSLLTLRGSSRSASMSRITARRIWNMVVILRSKRYLPRRMSATCSTLNSRPTEGGSWSPVRATLHAIGSSADNWVVCADLIMADKARKEVQRRMNKRVRLVELDFQPSLRETGWPSSTDMEFKCKG